MPTPVDPEKVRAFQLSYKKSTEGLNKDEQEEYDRLQKKFGSLDGGGGDAISRRIAKS